jgi:hypothetical protein
MNVMSRTLLYASIFIVFASCEEDKEKPLVIRQLDKTKAVV